jgi:hypothetical protein
MVEASKVFVLTIVARKVFVLTVGAVIVDAFTFAKLATAFGLFVNTLPPPVIAFPRSSLALLSPFTLARLKLPAGDII